MADGARGYLSAGAATASRAGLSNTLSAREINASRRNLRFMFRATPHRAVEPGNGVSDRRFPVPANAPGNQPVRRKSAGCDACWRSCPENVIQFDDNTLTIAAGVGTGWRLCGGMSASGAAARVRGNPPQRGHSAAWRSPAKAANVLSCSSPEHTHCKSVSPEFAVRLNFVANAHFILKMLPASIGN